MLSDKEIRIIIHEFKLGRNTAEAARNITKHGAKKAFLSAQRASDLKGFASVISVPKLKTVGRTHI